MNAPQFGQPVTPMARKEASLAALQKSSNSSLASPCDSFHSILKLTAFSSETSKLYVADLDSGSMYCEYAMKPNFACAPLNKKHTPSSTSALPPDCRVICHLQKACSQDSLTRSNRTLAAFRLKAPMIYCNVRLQPSSYCLPGSIWRSVEGNAIRSWHYAFIYTDHSGRFTASILKHIPHSVSLSVSAACS